MTCNGLIAVDPMGAPRNKPVGHNIKGAAIRVCSERYLNLFPDLST